MNQAAWDATARGVNRVRIKIVEQSADTLCDPLNLFNFHAGVQRQRQALMVESFRDRQTGLRLEMSADMRRYRTRASLDAFARKSLNDFGPVGGFAE